MNDHNAFLRKELLPALPPPMGQRGAVLWMRSNLFSSWWDSLLTVLGLGFVIWLGVLAFPWLNHSVWNAGSLTECRQIITATWGEGATGACWAVMKDRGHQYIFGFYPAGEYWRPVLALVLMFVALGPILFGLRARIALLFTFCYPMLAFWLLWGGSFWWPVGVLLGFVVLAGVFWQCKRFYGVIIGAVAGIVAAFLWWAYGVGLFDKTISGFIPVHLMPVASDRFGGFLLSFVIGVTAISASLPMGILLALGRQSDLVFVRMLAVGFIEFIRGVPLITLLFVASLLLQYFLPRDTKFDIILRVIILVTIFAAAYIAEIIRGGLASLPRGQYEAGNALGMDYWQVQSLIIMPQALKVSIPGIVSTFIGMFKDTTLVTFVGLAEPLRGITALVRADITWKGIYWEPYIFCGVIFFIICFGMSRYSMWLERRLKTDRG